MKAKIHPPYHGPSLIAPRPVIVWALEMEAGAAQRILESAPAALNRAYGTAFEQLAAPHPDPAVGVALLISRWSMALQNMANGVVREAGAYRDEGGVVRGWVGFVDPRSARKALSIGIRSVAEAGNNALFPSEAMRDAIIRYRVTAVPPHPDYIARILILGAHARGIPVMPSQSGPKMWQYGWGSAGRVFFEAVSDGDSAVGVKLSQQKTASTQFLRRLGYPATTQGLADNADEAVALARTVHGPVVIKPADQGKGRGVTVGITHEDDVRKAFAEARVHSAGPILVETFVPGFDHRLLVVRGKLLAAARREPASVTGDGQQTIQQLVQALNRRRAADPVSANYLKQIAVDQVLVDHLQLQGANLDTVPQPGRTLALRGNANVSTGGTPTDVMDIIHPDVRAMAEAIARNAGLRAIGIDYITPDISRSWRDTPSAIIEFNAAPGLDVHVGSGMDEAALGGAILGDVGRIPVAVVIAPRDQQARLLEVLADAPAAWRCGVVGPDGVSVAGVGVLQPDDDLPVRVAQVLENRDCAAALICVSADEVVQSGFPVDRCDLTLLQDDLANEHAATVLAYRCSDSVVRTEPGTNWPTEAALERLADVLGTSHHKVAPAW